MDETFEKITNETYGGKTPEDGYYSLVLYDKDMDTWLVRLHTNGKVEFNRIVHPEWEPDEFAERFVGVLQKTILAVDTVAENPMYDWEKEIAKIKNQLGYKDAKHT